MIVALLATTAVGVLTYRNIAAFALPRALNRIDTHAQLLGGELAASVRGARADVAGFRSSNAVIDIMTAHLNREIDPAAGVPASPKANTKAMNSAIRRDMGSSFVPRAPTKPATMKQTERVVQGPGFGRGPMGGGMVGQKAMTFVPSAKRMVGRTPASIIAIRGGR